MQQAYRLVSSQPIDLMGKVLANGTGDRVSIPGRFITKIQKLVLDSSLLNTQHYKVRIKGKVEQSSERYSAVPYISMLQLLKREPSGDPRLLLMYVVFFFN